MLTETGFGEPKFHGWTGYRTSLLTQGGLVTARKPLAGEVTPQLDKSSPQSHQP